VENGARAAATPAQAATDAEFVITMLPNGDLVRSVLFGEHGVCEGLSRDALVIDMSTIHPLQTDALIRDMAERGFSLMDAPSDAPLTMPSPARCSCWQAARRSRLSAPPRY
jgi:4-hydroxybutyrate dehydrogenase/sulfolactaldehyde 3-reductase